MSRESHKRVNQRSGAVITTLLLFGLVTSQILASGLDYLYIPRAGNPSPESPPLPPITEFPLQLVLDDDAVNGDFGVGGATARQFLWFNRFAVPGPFLLSQVWVLFGPGPNMAVGNAVQLAIYHDPDGNPANGADLLATFNQTIQAIDGTTFSVYDLNPPVEIIQDGGDVLIGVVSRFVVSGVTSPTTPAALDSTTSQQRSWIAVWTGDPPAQPTLPSDNLTTLIDDLGQDGNWMIRGFGTLPPTVAVPTLDWVGLFLFAAGLALLGAWRLRSRGLHWSVKGDAGGYEGDTQASSGRRTS